MGDSCLRTRSAGQETRATRSGVPRHSGTQPESKAQQHERTVRIEAGHVRLSASDVSNFLACRYLSHLDLLRAGGHIKPPESFDLGFQDIARSVPSRGPNDHRDSRPVR